MKTYLVVALVVLLAPAVFCTSKEEKEEKKEEKKGEKKNDKRGIYHTGNSLNDYEVYDNYETVSSNSISGVSVSSQRPIAIPRHYQLNTNNPYPLHVPQTYADEVPRPIRVQVQQPYPVTIPRTVPQIRPIPVQVPVQIPYQVAQPVNIQMAHPYNVAVPQVVRVPQPYVVRVAQPVYVGGAGNENFRVPSNGQGYRYTNVNPSVGGYNANPQANLNYRY